MYCSYCYINKIYGTVCLFKNNHQSVEVICTPPSLLENEMQTTSNYLYYDLTVKLCISSCYLLNYTMLKKEHISCALVAFEYKLLSQNNLHEQKNHRKRKLELVIIIK